MKIVQPKSFKKDVKRMQKRQKDSAKLLKVIEILASGDDLPLRYRDHALSGNWSGWNDCHLEPDWLLIYKRTEDELVLGRTGTHSDLF